MALGSEDIALALGQLMLERIDLTKLLEEAKAEIKELKGEKPAEPPPPSPIKSSMEPAPSPIKKTTVWKE